MIFSYFNSKHELHFKQEFSNEMFWNIQCLRCNGSIKIETSKENIGKTVDIVCQGCRFVYKTYIPDVNQIDEIFQNFSDVCTKILKDSPEVQEEIEKAFKKGFTLDSFLIAEIFPTQPEPESKVQENGDVGPEIFSTKDADWAKKLKIKLN
jgi:transcription elongation factor Elf1